LSKEKFVVDLILDLGEGKYVTNQRRLHHLKPEDYGLSRSTAWRVLKELENCGYVQKVQTNPNRGYGDKTWRLTEEMKTRLAQVQTQRNVAFWRDLDYILTFEDKAFENQIRERVYRLLGKEEVT